MAGEAENFRRTVSQVQLGVTIARIGIIFPQIKIHPLYQQGNKLNNDVCLLKLQRPVSFSAHPSVRPICLPVNSNDLYENKIAAGERGTVLQN